MSTDDHDLYGPHRTVEGYKAGVGAWDSPAVAEYKISEYRKQQTLEMMKGWSSPVDTAPVTYTWHAGPGRSAGPSLRIPSEIRWLFLTLVVISALCVAAIAWWQESGQTQFEKYLVSQLMSAREGVLQDRMNQYAHFSALDQWPPSVQAAYRKSGEADLRSVVRRHALVFGRSRTGAQLTEVGAQIWFRIAPHGPDAWKYLEAAIETSAELKKELHLALPVSLLFLKQWCDKGVESACLDAAKVSASMFYKMWLSEPASHEKALSMLPKAGPMAASPAILELKAQLNAPIAETDSRRQLMRVEDRLSKYSACRCPVL